MKVFIVGNGGREHAMAWKIKQNPKIEKIFSTPFNTGINEIGECAKIDVLNFENLTKFAKEKEIDLAIVSTDNPLVEGLVDVFENHNIRVFGPNKKAAMIEGSKIFSKELMKKYKIPTAKYEIFDKKIKAMEYVKKKNEYPIVIKADGLAYGKGVIIAHNFEEANTAVEKIMKEKIFGKSGDKIIIEDFLFGEEFSVLAFTDGKTIKLMPIAKDYKKIFDDNKGPNTGGMGSISPGETQDKILIEEYMEKIFIPTIRAMEKEGRKYKGVIYFGLILTDDGVKVIEYNCRFGDPETQVILPKLKTDLIEIFDSIIDEKLNEINIEWKNLSTVCVILASKGYPEKYEIGHEIYGLKNLEKENILIFHSGTKTEKEKILTNGGRVVGIVGCEKTIAESRKKTYNNIKNISFENMYFRKDIGK
ncbi:MAG: phosphoribosylamine--glycine ligase [Clostridiales bacterium]|jgi:phosphoribosylamine--glycine ligase|nr:phosphoribosylamine--glycine ligase [Clostridiales bacterium]